MPASELLREVARLYTRQQRDTVACCDNTSMTECCIVTELGRAGSLALRDLAHAIGYDKSWTSRAVDSLVEEGIVAKECDSDDRRRLCLTLTRKGEARFEAINEGLEEHVRRVMQRMPAEKRRIVNEALAILHDALKEECC